MAKETTPKPYLAGSETFELDGTTYAIQMHAAFISGVGVRTAAELAVDEEAQRVLLQIEGQNVATAMVTEDDGTE